MLSCRPRSRVAIVSLLFLVILIDSNSALAPDNIVTGCSSHCTLSFDKTLTCWNKTLDFFEQILLGQMRKYSMIQTYRAQWMAKRNWQFDYDKMKDESIIRMTADPPLDIEDEKAVADRSVYTGVISSLMENTKALVKQNLKLPTVMAPIACEHDWNPYFWMFLASSGLNLVIFSVIMILVWLLDLRDEKYSLMEEEKSLNLVVKLKRRKKAKKQQDKE